MTIHDIPTVVNDTAFGPAEFLGAIKAAEASRGAFVMAELGAGLGSWCVIGGHIARSIGRDPIRLYAVEASAARVENLKVHLSDNGFEPEGHTIISGVVGERDGFALFPQIDVLADFGASALFTAQEESRPGYDTVTAISVETLLANEPVVDFVHFDIQGAEADVIQSSIQFLTERVRYMVVGTHGRDLEYRIAQVLAARGWRLENEMPAKFIRSGDSEHLVEDGVQIWFNPRVQ